MNVQFQYEEAFWLLFLLLFFAFLFYMNWRWKKRTTKAIGDEQLIKNLFKNHSPTREKIKFGLILRAFALGTISLANPRRPDEASAEKRNGIDVVLALDVSKSMLATDVAPVRLQKAKDLLANIINSMPNDRIALILFAGHAYLQMPLTTDHEAAKMFLSNADPGAVPEPGTAIGDALKQADAAFDKSDRFKTVVLVTDGETHDEEALQNAKELGEKGIMINTVGIGSVQGSTIIDTATNQAKRDESGNIVVSKLNEQLLQQMAAATNGIYVHLEETTAATNQLLTQYKEVPKRALPDSTSMTYYSFYWWFTLPMFLLLIFELFMPDRRRVKE
jgi:Ca-activated chloride channel family protein